MELKKSRNNVTIRDSFLLENTPLFSHKTLRMGDLGVIHMGGGGGNMGERMGMEEEKMGRRRGTDDKLPKSGSLSKSTLKKRK